MNNKYKISLFNSKEIVLEAKLKDEINLEKEENEFTLISNKICSNFKRLKKNAVGGSIIPMGQIFFSEKEVFDIFAMGALSDKENEVTFFIMKP